MILVILVHASNGSFSVLNYTASLLQDSGMKISPELQSLSIPIFMTLGSIITITTIDKLGRKVSKSDTLDHPKHKNPTYCNFLKYSIQLLAKIFFIQLNVCSQLILGSAFAATAVAFACMATSSVLKMYGWTAPAWINVTMMMVLICCYGGAVSPLPFMIMAEIFNFQVSKIRSLSRL